MLNARKVATRLPAQDLDRARTWYAEKLGLEPAEERPGGLRYMVGGCEFALFASTGQSGGSFTQMSFEVADLRATVDALKARGVAFEDYDPPLATIDGQHPSKGVGEYGAWFRDSEGNLLGVGQVF
ncbi:hypothetical protein RCO27_17980 [Sphingosinicella sp. LHD-64]|uniref:VOC family protein n=1 Tax=Sphingosinicella sp. LHD-64 TaxID=3072139 RepID=UPI00280FD8B1|nr:VOC family protein [Sphingosinicella sp. LHD-64]MDQ8758119.1 hypothetical protein [Sphingosinicella sp. LHD-64]